MAKAAQRVVDERTGRVVLTAVGQAEGVFGSLMGLMFKKGLPDGHGLLFRKPRGIHTQFMRFPIDLIFFDGENRVTKVRDAMRPWRHDFTSAAGVIETNGGTARAMDVRVGDVLRFEPAVDG